MRITRLGTQDLMTKSKPALTSLNALRREDVNSDESIVIQNASEDEQKVMDMERRALKRGKTKRSPLRL